MIFFNVFCVFHKKTKKHLNLVFYFLFCVILFKNCFLKIVFKNSLTNNFQISFLFSPNRKTKKLFSKTETNRPLAFSAAKITNIRKKKKNFKNVVQKTHVLWIWNVIQQANPVSIVNSTHLLF